MTTTRNLLETAALVETDLSGDTWKVRLISEGKGSSGIYPAKTLEDYGHAFNAVLSFENHPIGWDGPESRNFKQIVGRVIGETWIETDERGKVGVYANWKPDPEYKSKLAEYKDALGLSIYIEGDGHLNEDGEFEVDSFNHLDPFRSVDVVIAAGRGGRFEESFKDLKKIYDSRRSESDTPTATAAGDRKETKMDEELKEALKGITDVLAGLVAEKNDKAAEAAQREADAEAVASAVEAYDAAVKAVDEAELLAPQRESILSAAKRGEDVTKAIESAKAVKEAAIEAVRVTESADQGRNFGTRKYESAADLGKVFG